MILADQKKYFESFKEKQWNTMLKKADDYANEDRLSSFKMAGSISGVTPAINCLNLIATKVARLGILLNSKKEPNNESIEDSILDMANYSILLGMILQDEHTHSKGKV